jgi:hypothetical protein
LSLGGEVTGRNINVCMAFGSQLWLNLEASIGYSPIPTGVPSPSVIWNAFIIMIEISLVIWAIVGIVVVEDDIGKGVLEIRSSKR